MSANGIIKAISGCDTKYHKWCSEISNAFDKYLNFFLCNFSFIVIQLVVEHFVQVYAVGCTMKCHINVLDFTPGPTSECSVDSTWFVIPLDNILL